MDASDVAGAQPGGQVADLDATDRRIVDALRADGRLSMRALAERLHISRATVYARVERLHHEGVITGYTALIDHERYGQGLAAYVYVKISQHSWKSVQDRLAALPQIEHGALVTGEFDLVLFVRTADATALRDLVLTDLQSMPEVLSTQTVLIFDELAPGRPASG